jgi:Putative peptidoglycan binding domain
VSEVLARSRTDSLLTRSAVIAPVKAKTPWPPIRWANRLTAQTYVAGALTVLLAGICVNALLLQHERHPAPLFGSVRSEVSLNGEGPSSVQRPPAAALPRETSMTNVVAAQPPQRPLSERGPDQIGDLLRGEAPGDSVRAPGDNAHLILAVQNALIKLGFDLKPDGSDGAATRQAIRQFERAHGLPVTTEITARLAREVVAAARNGH